VDGDRERPAPEIDLVGKLGRAHQALALINTSPRDAPLRLSLAHAKWLLPTDIVNLCLVLEAAQAMGFPGIELVPPPPGFIGVYMWRIGFYGLFPQHAPPPPRSGLGFRDNDQLIELRRFTDLAGILELRDRLPRVLTAAPGAEDVPGGVRTLRRLAGTVYELAENAVAHSRRLSPGAPVVGYYMVQRMPNKRTTFLVVGDAGDGIPATMQAEFRDLVADVAAIRHALQPGVSGNGGGGNGLFQARRAIDEIPGSTMTIESGAAVLRVRTDGSEEHQTFPDAAALTRVSFRFPF
jgi:hypothetical protein